MKMLTVSAVLCAMIALTIGTALLEEEAKEDQTAESHLVKRTTRCSGGWSRSKRRCFTYNPRPMTWAEAEKNCQSMGGNLASVHNIKEYHKIQSLIFSFTHQYKEAWVGASDAQQEGVWLWSDGTLFHYTNWCPGEPNNHGKQHCGQINFGDGKCWDDVSCGVRRPSVCSKIIKW